MAGATLEFTFKDEEVQAMARRFREQLTRVRFRPLLAAIGNELVTSVSRRFETGTAPDGSRWPESLRARLTGGQTLIRTGRLRDSIAETGPQLTARSVEVGTNVVYAAIHQFGGIIPPHIIRARRARALSIPGIGFRRAVHHPGGTIPARPYLGLSDTDERVIQDLTEDWLRKTMAKMRGPFESDLAAVRHGLRVGQFPGRSGAATPVSGRSRCGRGAPGRGRRGTCGPQPLCDHQCGSVPGLRSRL